MPNIAVIGGNGYLGTHITEYFDAEPLSRQTGFDVTDMTEDQKNWLKEFNVVIHMAALVDKSEQNVNEVFRVNAEGTKNVLQALREGQIFIFTSTAGVYLSQEKRTAYEKSKVIAEHYIGYYTKYKQLRTGVFRMGTVYAPSVSGSSWINMFVNKIKNNEPLELYLRGRQVRDFLYVTDLARAFEKWIDSGDKECYNIGGAFYNECTILELVRKMEEILNKEANLILTNKSPKHGFVNYCTDITNIQKDLNWKPKISIEEGIRRLI